MTALPEQQLLQSHLCEVSIPAGPCIVCLAVARRGSMLCQGNVAPAAVKAPPLSLHSMGLASDSVLASLDVLKASDVKLLHGQLELLEFGQSRK